jgi:hypothetical protein
MKRETGMKWFAAILPALMAVPLASGQSTFPALLADGPNQQYRNQLQLFGQFVGSWTFKGTEYHDDGSRTTDKGEIHCQWVLEGRALQDVFLETSRSDHDTLLHGTTIRFYDPKIDAWSVTWINPGAGVVRTFMGRKSGNEIVMEGKASDGSAIRWIFSNIKTDAFHWHGEKLTGTEWRTYEELDARRE